MSEVKFEKEIVMRKINTIKPYVRNPRRNGKTVDALVKIIPKVGFNVPIVIDEKGIIVKGHARFTAAIRLGMREVPCIITHADEEAIKADRLADNKISEFSEWITDELMSELEELDFDLSDIGLAKPTLEDIPDAEEVIKTTPVVATAATISEEQKEKMYEDFKKDQQTVAKAVEEFGEKAFYKCVCNKCGYVMFIKEDEL